MKRPTDWLGWRAGLPARVSALVILPSLPSLTPALLLILLNMHRYKNDLFQLILTPRCSLYINSHGYNNVISVLLKGEGSHCSTKSMSGLQKQFRGKERPINAIDIKMNTKGIV